MLNIPEQVIVPSSAGKRPWEIPDALWKRAETVRIRRMRAVIARHVLPLLQELESLYLARNPDATPRLVGKTFAEAEQCDTAIEAALFLFELAQSSGLIKFNDKTGSNKKSAKIGSCGMSVDEVKDYYLKRASSIIMLKKGRHSTKLDKETFGSIIRDVRELTRVRTLAQFNRMTIRELHIGLKDRFSVLLELDPEFLSVMADCNPEHFIRPLRLGLVKQFPKFLTWPIEKLRAVAEGLDHSAKITAMGTTLLVIDNPDTIRAIGTWPVREVAPTVREIADGEDNKKKYVSRITEIKKVLGPEAFQHLLDGDPGVIKMVGGRKNIELEKLKFFLPYLTAPIARELSILSVEAQLNTLDALWKRLGREYLEIVFHDQRGAKMAHNLCADLKLLIDHNKITIDKIEEIVLGDYSNKHFIGLPPRPKDRKK